MIQLNAIQSCICDNLELYIRTRRADADFDRATSETKLVSVASDGSQANHDSDHPFLSSDGRIVAFDSTNSARILSSV